MTAPESVTPDVAAPQPAALWEDFIDIFYAPSAVFARRRADPKFGLALLVLVVLMVVLFLIAKPVLTPIFDAEFSRAAAATIRNNPQVTSDAMESMHRRMDKFAMLIPMFGVPITVFMTALVLWIIGKLFDAKQSYTAAAMVATYANFPRLLQQVLGIVQGYVMSPDSLSGLSSISLSPARFFDPTTASPVLLAALGRIDLFTIWATVLLAIGLSITGSTSRRQAAGAAALTWLVGSAYVVLQALRTV